MASKLFAYRPGLDGIRGYSMVVFMLWHVGVLTFLPGAWILMNVFFILSAFLITRLLLAEQREFGWISVREFYRRRVRRLAPALLVMVGAVTVDGWAFAPAAERTYLRGDILATLTYVMNWRLVLRDDQYFEEFTHPSITRHAWSLSVEEQFYLVVPLLVIAALTYAHRRSARTAGFVVLALVSAAWASTIDLDSPGGQAHAYYGTDVRVQALALGVAAGVWTGHRGRGGGLLRARDRRDPLDAGDRRLEILGWVGLVATLTGIALIEPLSDWMFTRGGMLLTSLAGLAWIIGCAQRVPTPLVRLHANRLAVHTGKISYGLYLYHWPIYLWLVRAFGHGHVILLAVATLVLSYAAADASYRWLEKPVIKRGVRAFGGRRAGGAGAVGIVGVLVAALAIPAGASTAAHEVSAPQYPQYVAHIPTLVEGQATYTPPARPLAVTLYGDSVPYFLAQRMPKDNFSNLVVTNAGAPGCDLLDAPVQWTATRQQPNDTPCRDAKAAFGPTVRSSGSQMVVLMPTLYLALRHDVDGKVLWLDDAAYRDLITRTLTKTLTTARTSGAAKFAVTTVPCRTIDELQVPPEYRDDFDKFPQLVAEAGHPKRVNAMITAWAKEHHVPVLDLAGAVCGSSYQPTRHGITLYDDGIHFSPEATPMIWGWLAPQIVAAAR